MLDIVSICLATASFHPFKSQLTLVNGHFSSTFRIKKTTTPGESNLLESRYTVAKIKTQYSPIIPNRCAYCFFLSFSAGILIYDLMMMAQMKPTKMSLEHILPTGNRFQESKPPYCSWLTFHPLQINMSHCCGTHNSPET